MMRETQMPLLLTHSKLVNRLPRQETELLCLNTGELATPVEDQYCHRRSATARNLASIIYTSGSTGTPKGVAVEHRSLVNFTQAAARLFGIEPGDRVLQFASLSFDASAEEIYPCLTRGATLVLRSEAMLSRSARFVQTCQQWGLTVLDLPTAYWHELVADLGREEIVLPACLRLVIIGGELALAERLTKWQRSAGHPIDLLNTYGPTETTVAATAHRVRREDQQIPNEAAVIGRALPNVQVYVLDRHLQAVPLGVPGELYIGGVGVARGYLGRPELTAERFVPDPFSRAPGARLYRTGDLARRLPDGMLEYRGRLDTQVKLRGFRVETNEIESVLTRHPLVREAVVLAREDRPGDKRLVAYVVTDQEQTYTKNQIRDYVQQHLPGYMLPASFVLLDTLPQTASGKVDRRALPAPEQLTSERADVWELPRTPGEELLAGIWAQVLHLEQVSRHDHFFESGGHSLLATQLVARIRELFGVDLTLRAIFETPTLAGLAEEIETVRRSQQPLQIPPLTPRSRDGEVALSYAQQRLWFIDQLEPGSPAYNIALALRLMGRLAVDALRRSLSEIVWRHEALRTTFVARHGHPVQVIAPPGHLRLLLVDMSNLVAEEQELEVYRLAQQEAQQPFDLAQGPLIRTTLIRLDDDQHLLLLTLHHIITDAWSVGLLLQELAALYRADVRGEDTPLPAPAIQYADYAIWQRQWLEEQSEGSGEEVASLLERQLAYWREQLAGAPPLLELPADHPRPQEQTFRGAHYTFALPSTLVTALHQLSRQEGATLFMTLLAAFAVLLSRYSGQEDIVIGTPIANRTRAEVEGVIGFFINTLALRTDLSGHLSVRELLRRVREVALEAYAHQDLPFERLVDALHPERDLSYTPLCQVMFVLQNVATAPLDLPGLTVELLPVESGIARFDLTLTMQEGEQDVQGVLEYNLDLFEPITIERLARHFQMVLEAMVTQPQQHLRDVTLLTEAERRQLLVNWNATGTIYPQDRSLTDLFEEQVERAPEAIALVFEGQQLTYGELNARANQLTHHLHQLGVRSETLVGVALERSLDMVVGLLGILKAGGAYVPLDLSYPAERLAFMLEDAQISVLLTHQELLERFSKQKGIRAVCLDADWPAIARLSREPLYRETRAEQLAYVIYTSGSTGQPKGVQVQQRSIARLVCGTDYVRLDERQTLLQMAPISFDAATFELWGALLHGGRCVLFTGDLPGVQALGEVLRREAVSTLWLTASLFNVIIDEAPQALAGVRQLLVGGEALSVSHVRRGLEALPDVQLINGYGPTENTTFSCCYPIESARAADVHSIPIGRPIANSQAYVLDQQGQPVPVGVIGELYLGGAGLARGYLRRPELTAERFVPHPFSQEPGARLYRTGDLVRSLPDGSLEFLGRADQQVKLHGFRIELGEIEAVLRQHPLVREAVVLMREEVPGNQRLVAYVVPQQPMSFAVGELRHYFQARLPDYMVPAAFVLLEALPLTPNGKLDRRALPAPESNRLTLDNTYVSPQTPVETALATIWAQVLRVEQVGIHDNFFELGGDSILSIQVVARATAAGLPLTPRHLFQHQTIARLAAVVGSVATVQAQQEVVLGPMPLIAIHHWFFQQPLPQPQHWNQALLIQIRQPLVPALLRDAVQALLLQHDALRLRAQHRPEGWQLLHAAPDDRVPFTLVDLTGIADTQQGAALEAATAALQTSLDLVNGPALRVALFDLGASQPARLLLVIHHLAVDLVSWPLLLEDLQTACQQLSQGQPVRLPPKTTSYQQWALRLSEYAQSPEVYSQLDFWLAQSWQEARPLPLDIPEEYAINTEASARTVVVALSPEETQALLSEVPQAYHTHINEVLLTALVQAFARWTGTPSLLLHLEGHGREDLFEEVDLSRTVGWFTSLVPLVLSLDGNPGPGAALKYIKESLRRVPQGGISFGLLRYLSQEETIKERLAVLPQPQVSFNYAGRSVGELAEGGFFASTVESPGATHSPQGQRPHVLEINSRIEEGQLYLGWTYSQNLHRRSTIEELAHGYLAALQALIRHCQSPEAGGYTPSDFPEARLSQARLDTLVATLAEARDGLEVKKPNLEAIYPLSPMQEGLLFHSLYASRSEAYFEQFAYTLHGDLDVQAFKHTWQQVVTYHPILRTLFLWERFESAYYR